ncbi:hypothetical protein A9179_07660 [Pseudomonas alcaligenes]|uniref:VWFA domain-containing protein n=1 Tax=Aquipseudomonas alcaligenes TaxID=43263 RepID=A0ABR7RZG6_AQUAC|nr:hypothetical protein [Pseudomonas alcaligenes]MBC9250147.1 hypothetical protein [Pseudomonas alcaligenes]
MLSADHLSAFAVWPAVYANGQGESPGFVASERALSDRQAAWRRWHRPQALQRFNVVERLWYESLEWARVETLASRHLPGMRVNLVVDPELPPGVTARDHLYRCARWVFSDAEWRDEQWKLPAPPAAGWWARIAQRPGQRLEHLQALLPALLPVARASLEDAQSFADKVEPLVRLYVQIYADTVGPHVPGLAPVVATAAAAQSLREAPQRIQEEGGDEGYKVYSHRWDRVLTRRELVQLPAEPSMLAPSIDAEARRLAQLFRRRLLARQPAGWRFDLEVGALDSRRLASLVSSNNRAVFRQESNLPAAQACVTLLLDVSGSMRGRPWQLASLAVDLAVQALEAAGIRCEVLGYGTGTDQENPLLRAWQEVGAPLSPGRLNAMRYLIFKAANQPWRLCRDLLGRQGIVGGENIDGEALHWAASRLLRQPQARRILLVLSDGQPHDDATRRANGSEYLDLHLHNTIAEIERGSIHLAAFGAGQGVSRFYRNSRVLGAPEEIFRSLFGALDELLGGPRGGSV